MKEENNEIVETEVEKVEKEESVVDSQPKKKNKSSIIVPILVAVVAFVIVYGGITLYNHLSTKNDVVEKDESKDESKDGIVKDDVNEDEASDDSVVEDNASEAVGGTTGPDEVITITDAMKKELNGIASIRDGYCEVERTFYNMNGFLKDLPVESKRRIVLDYFVINNVGVTEIDEVSYSKIAAKYEFEESFDVMFAGYEKSGNNYVIPPMGCVGPETVSHNVTYLDTGNTVTVTDNVTITNNETKATTNIKVIYTFIYYGEGDNITFSLHQINTVK